MSAMNRRDALRLITSTMGIVAYSSHAVPSAPAGNAILKRPIPSSNEMLPVVGLGTWQTFDVGSGSAERAPLQKVLQTFIDHGGSVIDSSPMYGRSEDVAGDLASQLGLRPKLFVATKVWTHGKSAGIKQMQESLRKLRANPIDLIQVHNLIDVDTHLDTLREWKRDGRVRYIGITHYTASAQDDVIRVAQTHPVDFIQINYSVGEREAEKRLLPFAKDKGIAVIANRPFASGELFRRLRNKPLPAWTGEIDCHSWAQLMLKYVISHPAITCAIPATSNPGHVVDNMQAGFGRMPDARLRNMIVAEVSA
jgi:diketogulonate reductase-like aldo/keto reductase